jgi:hypothetical protein
MIIIYHAANSLDANMIKSLLEQYRIAAFIQGEYLQGGVGELPVAGLVTVSVNNDDQFEARKIVHEWEVATIVEEQSNITIPLGGELNGAF